MIHVQHFPQKSTLGNKIPFVAQPVFPVACGDVDGWGRRDALLVWPELFIDLEEVLW